LKYLPAHAVLPFDKKDNFWMMGDTGPCGPCTEIHYDRIGGRDASALVNLDDPDVLEVWNVVFIQYNASLEDGQMSLELLPAKSIDTGMGFERILSVLQNKPSNYDTDLFGYLFDAIQASCPKLADRPYSGKVGADDTDRVDMAYRVVADHIRTLTFALTDGAHIGNNGRDYVLKRIIRRACRYGRQYFGAEPGFFSGLVPVFIEKMSGAFPELLNDPAAVQAEMLEEELQFGRTLDRGTKKFEEFAERAVVKTVTCIEGEELIANTYTDKLVIDGNDAFMLYDTFGFPLDLTDLMAEERDMKVDHEGFKARMEEQRRQSRGEKGEGEQLVLEAAETDDLSKKGVEPTDDSAKYDWDSNACTGVEPTAQVMAIFKGKAGFTDSAPAGEQDIGVVLNSTCFYAEAGGQVFDTGVLTLDGVRMDVLECKKFGAYVLHIGRIVKGSLTVGSEVNLSVNYKRRSDIAMNHTSTHILNYALRSVLGGKVDQRGSLVVPEKLRFDFTQGKGVKEAQLIEVQKIVQDQLDAKHQIYTKECNLAEARAICALRAVFGEKYPDPVRVVSIGQEIDAMISAPDNEEWNAYSVEFCGGTHLGNSTTAGKFLITSEEPVSKGVRRIVACTGNHAVNVLEDYEEIKSRVQACNDMEPENRLKECKLLQVRVESATLHIEGKAELTNMLKKQRKDLLAYEKAEMKKKEEKAIADSTDLIAKLKGSSEKSLVLKFDGDKTVVNSVVVLFNKELPDVAIFALGMHEAEGQMCCITSVPEAMRETLPANEWCNAGMSVADGKGGGKVDRAQGNAKGLIKGKEVCDAAAVFAHERLSSQ